MLIARDEHADAVRPATSGLTVHPRTVNSRIVAQILLIVALLLTICGHASAAPQPPRSMLVILLPGTTLSDWLNDPALHKLMDQGAVALMNTRTARMPNDKHREPPDAAILTLAAGARAAVPTSPQVIRPLTPAYPNWVYPHWAQVVSANQSLGYQIELANLAEGLKAADVKLCSIKFGGWVADEHGHIVPDLPDFDTYDLADLLANNHGTTCSLEPDYYFAMTQGIPLSRFRVSSTDAPPFDHGVPPTRFATCAIIDLSRDQGNPLDTSWLKSPAPMDAWNHPYLSNVDHELSALSQFALKSQTRLLILSPFVNDRAYAVDDRLAPVLMLGDGVPHGLLYSPSTRHAGLITNTDIAPTVAEYLGAKLPTPAFGSEVQLRSFRNPIRRIDKLRSLSMEQRRSQRVLPYCAVGLGICLLGLAFANVRKNHNYAVGFVSTFNPILLTFLVIGHPRTVGVEIIVALLFGIANAVSRNSLENASKITPRFMALTAGLLLLDAAFDGQYLRFGVLGYSPIEGARYYGIGNEAMGVLTGAILVLLSAWWPLHSRSGGIGQWGLLAAMLATVAIVGWPSMGAKAGGVIVLTGAFLIFVMSATGKQLTGRRLLAAAIAGIVTLAGFAIADSMHASGSRSHMGAAIALIHHGGISQALDIIGRKLAVEFKLATHSTWALPVWAGLVCLIIQRKRALASANQAAIALLDSTLVAAILMLLFNDAGAVACALLLSIVCSFAAAAYGPLDQPSTTSTANRPSPTEVHCLTDFENQ